MSSASAGEDLHAAVEEIDRGPGCGKADRLRLGERRQDNEAERGARVQDVNAEHREIMEAVLNRDTALAVALMYTHVRKTEEAVARRLAPAAAGKTGG